MSTNNPNAGEQAVSMPSRTVVPTSLQSPSIRSESSTRTNSGVGFPKEPDKPKYKAWELGSVGISNEKRGGSTEVDLKLDMEFEAFDLLDRLQPIINMQTSDAELSLYSEIIQAKFGKWKTKQELFTLYRKDIDERRKIKEMTNPAPGRILHWHEREMNKDEALRKLEDKITKRKKNIKTTLAMEDGTGSIGQEKDKKLQEFRKELGIKATVSDEDFRNQLNAYISEEPHHVFDSLGEVVQSYAYLEQVEKDVVLQAGYDITDGGTRTIQINFSNQNIQRMTEEGVEPRIVQALRDIGNRIRVRDLRGVEEIIAAGGVGLWENMVSGPIAGAAGVGGMVLSKIVARRIYNWYVSFPEGKAPEEVSFPLNFHRIGTELGDSKDPIRQMYRGRIDEAGLFLKNCDRFRVGLADALGVHAGELDGWLNLSSSAMGVGAAGMEIPYKIAFAKQLEKVLVLEFKKTSGGHKKLEDLALEEQIGVVNRVSDSIALVYGAEIKDEIVENVSIRRALGLKEKGGIDWSARKSALTQLSQDIKNGKRVFHRKPGAQTLEEAKSLREQAEVKKNKLTELKTQFTTQVGTYRTKETDFETARQESEKTQLINGHLITGRDPITGIAIYADRGGKISIKVAEETRKQGERTRLYTEIGVDPGTGAVTAGSLFEHYTDTKTALSNVTADLEARQKQKDEATREKTRLESQTVVNPAAVAVQDGIITTCVGDLPGLQTAVTNATKEHNKYKTPYESKTQKIETIEIRLGAIPDEIEALRETVLEKDALFEAARLARNNEFNKIKEILRDFGYTEEEMNATGFAVPTEATLTEKINTADADFQKKNKEYAEMKEREEAGNATVISDEDLELIKINELLAGSVETTFLNQLMADVIGGKINIEEFAKVTGDAGINFLLKRLYGEDSLSTGPEGKYRMVTQLFSKARLVDAIFEVWHLEGRATTAGFFEGDSEGVRLYQEGQFIKQANRRLAEKINQLEFTKPSPASTAEEITRLRSEFRANNLKRNEMLARLYDRPDRPERRLASFLAQDRIKTAETLRVTLDHLYNDALNGFVELVSPLDGARTERTLTSAGTVVVSETKMDQLNRQIMQRGEFNVEGLMGYPGVSVDVQLTTDDPTTGNIDVVIGIDREHGGLDNLPNLPFANLPRELAIVYGGSNQRRLAVSLSEFTQEMLNSIPHATRAVATGVGMDPVLINLVYGPNPASGKRSLNQIRSSSINLTTLPANRGPVTAPEVVKDFFYYYSDTRRKNSLNWQESVAGITAAHAVLPATRGAASAAGFTPQLVDMFYGANAGDPPRSVADITTGRNRIGVEFSLDALPYENTLPGTIPAPVRNLFYELKGRKRSNIDIDAYITSLPANRVGALGIGLTPEVVNLLYEPGAIGDKRNVNDLRKIVIPRDHIQITNLNRLITLVNNLNLRGVTPASEVFLHNISESFSMLDEVSKTRLLGGRITPFTIGATQITFENGDINVTYVNAATGTSFPMKLNEYITNQTYPPEMGAYLNANPNHKRDVIQNIARNIIETVRRTNI